MTQDKAALQDLTEDHYARHPFEFMNAEDERDIEATQPSPFVRFINQFATPKTAIAEIGCGPGRGTMFLASRGLNVTALDLTFTAVQLARKRAKSARFLCATNLTLPFADAAFDIVVSDGVIHHTPDPRQSFREIARILKPGGHAYVGVYNRRRYYFYLYNHLGKPVRWLEKNPLGRALVYATIFPPYYLAHLIKSRGKRTLMGAKNFFYDYIITPQATFHTKEEMEQWGREEGLKLLDYDPVMGNVHVFFFEKTHG